MSVIGIPANVIKQPSGSGNREHRCICGHTLANHIIDLAFDDSICVVKGCSCQDAHLWCILFRAPDGKQYMVHDVAKFVRVDFPQLFTAPDRLQKVKPHDNSDYTVAEDGLRHLAAGYCESWHNWTVITKPKTYKQ